MDPIVNKVANSGLITLDLEEILNHPKGVLVIDMKDFLFQGLILKEKDFRQELKQHNWEVYQNHIVAITDSVGAIIPTWAYMLLGTHLADVALFYDLCDAKDIKERYYLSQIENLDLQDYAEARIVLKGCGQLDMPNSIYARMTQRLKPVVKSLMFGEPCSTVPVYKKKK